jgi:hypothetical protein
MEDDDARIAVDDDDLGSRFMFSEKYLCKFFDALYLNTKGVLVFTFLLLSKIVAIVYVRKSEEFR